MIGRPKGVKSKRLKRYCSKENTYEFVKLIMSGEVSSTELAKVNGMKSNGILFRWIKKYQEHGIEALENQCKLGNPITIL